MKSFVSAVIILFVTFGVFPAYSAQAPTRAHVCKAEQGKVWVGSAEGDVSMCFFDGAAIGTRTLYDLKTQKKKTEAILAYENGAGGAIRGGVCGSFAAEAVEVADTQGQSFHVCRFEDGSVIEETTLWLGSGNNDLLDKALSK